MAQFGLTVPSGLGYDFAGVIDEAGSGVVGFAVGDRVYGGAMARAAADFVVVKTPADALWRTPEGISDVVASTLPVAGRTAAAALAAIGLRSDDTVLIGGAVGVVGVFAVQLARLDGATVIGTASEGTFEFVRQLGAEPVVYGPGLADRVLPLAPGGVTAAADLFGTETAEAALALGVPPGRITTIAAGPNPPGGVRATRGGADASPADLDRITDAILASKITELTLQDYADFMLSLSDNTAADHLIHFLGRDAVQAQLFRFGNANPGRDIPFLSTRELFALRSVNYPALADSYLAGSPAQRTAMLAALDQIPLSQLSGWTQPEMIDQIEWLASPADICGAYADLWQENAEPGMSAIGGALSINDGGIGLDPARYPVVWFKGGSEPGVVTLNYLARASDGQVIVSSVMLADPGSPITGTAELEALALARGGIQLATR